MASASCVKMLRVLNMHWIFGTESEHMPDEIVSVPHQKHPTEPIPDMYQESLEQIVKWLGALEIQ